MPGKSYKAEVTTVRNTLFDLRHVFFVFLGLAQRFSDPGFAEPKTSNLCCSSAETKRLAAFGSLKALMRGRKRKIQHKANTE